MTQHYTNIKTKQYTRTSGSDGISSKKPEQVKLPATKHTVAVIGLGYVGLPLALAVETRGYSIIGIDTDQNKVRDLRERTASYLLLTNTERARLAMSTMRVFADNAELQKADTVVVCVPTPVDEKHLPNLGPLEGATRLIAEKLRKGQLVVIESTVNPGVCEDVVLPILEKTSGLTLGKDFYLAHCPERINPGDSRWTVETIPRVIGANDKESLARAVQFYGEIIDGNILPMGSLKEAEAVKIVENSFRDINIAFVNELAMSFDKLGIDTVNVINGAATKPFSFLAHYPGCGVGGHCIPVDPYYLITHAQKNGFQHRFLATAREINNGMPLHTVNLLEKELAKIERPITAATVALLGLSYKKNVPDLRESPALVILEELKRRGAKVKTFDPLLPKESTAASLESALFGTDAAILATDHENFRNLSPELLCQNGVRILMDGRNFFPKQKFIEAGIVYKGIGR